MENQHNPKQIKSWWKSKKRSEKIIFIFSGAVSLLVLGIVLIYLSAREIGATQVADALFGENTSGWQWLGKKLQNSGINWFLTFIVIGVAIMINFLLTLLVSLITWRGKRSRTVGSLIRSLAKYLICIITAGFVLSVWGVDIGSIVAGLGIVTLIIGLGCQSLISDIVSGLFLVFDDFFDVGDIVVIDGFRGTISEIGLRSTKVTDWAGNIKSITNSQVNTVINLSRLASAFTVSFTIDGGADLERAESILMANLKSVAHSIPKVIGEIEYRGVGDLDQSGIQFIFLAQSEEDDRYQVIRDIRRELYLLMRRNGIAVPFHKIYVQQDEPSPTTNEEGKDTANS